MAKVPGAPVSIDPRVQESTLQNRLKYADLTTVEQIRCDVEYGFLTCEQAEQVYAAMRAARVKEGR